MFIQTENTGHEWRHLSFYSTVLSARCAERSGQMLQRVLAFTAGSDGLLMLPKHSSNITEGRLASDAGGSRLARIAGEARQGKWHYGCWMEDLWAAITQICDTEVDGSPQGSRQRIKQTGHCTHLHLDCCVLRRECKTVRLTECCFKVFVTRHSRLLDTKKHLFVYSLLGHSCHYSIMRF